MIDIPRTRELLESFSKRKCFDKNKISLSEHEKIAFPIFTYLLLQFPPPDEKTEYHWILQATLIINVKLTLESPARLSEAEICEQIERIFFPQSSPIYQQQKRTWRQFLENWIAFFGRKSAIRNFDAVLPPWAVAPTCCGDQTDFNQARHGRRSDNTGPYSAHDGSDSEDDDWIRFGLERHQGQKGNTRLDSAHGGSRYIAYEPAQDARPPAPPSMRAPRGFNMAPEPGPGTAKMIPRRQRNPRGETLLSSAFVRAGINLSTLVVTQKEASRVMDDRNKSFRLRNVGAYPKPGGASSVQTPINPPSGQYSGTAAIRYRVIYTVAYYLDLYPGSLRAAVREDNVASREILVRCRATILIVFIAVSEYNPSALQPEKKVSFVPAELLDTLIAEVDDPDFELPNRGSLLQFIDKNQRAYHISKVS